MTKFICILPICSNPTNCESVTGEKRIQQYIDGFNKFFEYISVLNDNLVDIYIFDNTVDKNSKIHDRLLEVIPPNVTIINDIVNTYGKRNKGAGLIEMWRYLRDIITNYDFLIHFEPRQLLLNFDFIHLFFENPNNLFTYGENKIHFNTGLFCINCTILLSFIDIVDIEYMSYNSICVEYLIFDFFIENKIPYNVTEKMNLIWFPFNEKIHYM
jgi:hypothetical protein